MPPKAKGRRNREAVKPISGLDVDALLGENSKGQITPENAVPDFKRAMATSEEISDIQDAAKQMADVIESLVTDSFGDSKYAQAVECIGVMREELIDMEEPDMYNSFVRELKKSLLSGSLGGDRRDFWFKVRWSRLGLIEQSQSEVSKVTADEADEVRQVIRGTCAHTSANRGSSFINLDSPVIETSARDGIYANGSCGPILTGVCGDWLPKRHSCTVTTQLKFEPEIPRTHRAERH